jgi:hypothetical protein
MTSVTVVVPMTIRRRGGRKQIIGPDGALVQAGGDAAEVAETHGDPALVKALVKALARAFRWRRMLEEARYASIRELAAAEKVDTSQVARLLRLTLLAPEIIEAILDGRERNGTTSRLMAASTANWCAQRETLGRTCASALKATAPTARLGLGRQALARGVRPPHSPET